jgi:pilus assembly protein Flp/PilA
MVWVYLESLRIRLTEECEAGQGLVEYGLILALVAVVAIVALTGLGTKIADVLTQISAAL